jgi:predicted amidophosphoribosyltransferase
MKNQASEVISLLSSEKRYYGIDELYHVAYYHAARVGYQDVISRSLHDFKDGIEPQTARWIRLAAPAAAAELECEVIVRALRSTEETVSAGTPLDRLCKEIASAGGAEYAPERLTKNRMVRPLTTLAGRALRQKELEGVYEFSAEGLLPDSRILIVDDLATTGSTMAAIVKAIRAALPEALLTCFVLARVEAQIHNTHLNAGYFLHGDDPIPHEKAGRDKETQKMTPAMLARAKATDSPKTRPQPAPRHTSPPAGAPAAQNKPRSSTNRFPVSPALPPKQRGWDTRVYVVGLMLSLMVLGATVLFPAKKGPASPPPQFATLVAENSVRSPDPIPERREMPPPVLEGKPGMVTVPGTGLRANHSMDSRVLPKATVHLRERVDILRRFTSQVGPDWIQVRTRNGSVGWVVASVVREVKG